MQVKGGFLKTQCSSHAHNNNTILLDIDYLLSISCTFLFYLEVKNTIETISYFVKYMKSLIQKKH